jgi:tRNA nucleotidyltransferase (CCA-adding enzyme)
VALVGGCVRDLALGLELRHDIDVLVQGDAVALATALAHATGGHVDAAHAAFGTATVRLRRTGGILAVDLATARAETYAHPAALPVVTPTTLEADLVRRDFSINAAALELLEQQPLARLLDPFGGMADLASGQLRVLHEASLRDDPTRILRGARLAARLGLTLEAKTAELLCQALAEGMLERTGAERVQTELCLALAEPQPNAVLELAASWALLPHLGPLGWGSAQQDRWARAWPHRPADLPAHTLALGLLTYDLDVVEREDLIRRYRLPGGAAKLMREIGAIGALRSELGATHLAASYLAELLQPFSLHALTIGELAEDGTVRAAISRFLAELRPLPPLLSGRDLLDLGVAAGPQVGALLARIRAAQLDGLVRNRDEALELLRRLTVDH